MAAVMAQMPPLPCLEDYTAFVRRYVALLCAGMLVGFGAGWVVLSQQQPMFTASASVLLAPLSSFADTDPAGRSPRLVTIDTDAHLVTSAPVVRRVARATSLPPGEVRSGLSVSAEPLTQVLRISFSAADASRAARGAQVAAKQLLVQRGKALASTDVQVQVLRDTINAIRRETRRPEVGSTPNVLGLRLAQLRDFLNDVEAGSTATGQVVNRAATPRQARVVNAEVPLASGLMLGLLLAVMVGALHSRLRRPGRPAPGTPTQQTVHQHTELVHSLPVP